MIAPQILTRSGRYFDFETIDLLQIDIQDIAHALAHTCRFGGHCASFYSVAQHSVYVSELVEPEHALAALLHDASEAYLGDVVQPLKQHLPHYREIEDRVERAIAERFGLPHPLPLAIKAADLCMLATERRDLMPDTPDVVWQVVRNILPREARIRTPWTPTWAKSVFLHRYERLVRGQH